MDGLWWFPWVFLIPLIWFLIGILILIWVYRDAESREMNGLLWAIIVFFLNIIGLILYLVVRENRKPSPIPSPPSIVTQRETQPHAVREKEIVREKEVIVKVRCPYCHRLYDETRDECPYCRGSR